VRLENHSVPLTASVDVHGALAVRQYVEGTVYYVQHYEEAPEPSWGYYGVLVAMEAAV
jgi:hypothetical protein